MIRDVRKDALWNTMLLIVIDRGKTNDNKDTERREGEREIEHGDAMKRK